jgi:hypothetical protein
LKTTSKDRPDYAEFMRKAPSQELSPFSDPNEATPITEAEIPWAEIIVEPELEDTAISQPEPMDYTFANQPPLPSLITVALMVVAFLSW